MRIARGELCLLPPLLLLIFLSLQGETSAFALFIGLSSRRPTPTTLSAVGSMEQIHSRLAALNLVLPAPGAPKANYQLLHREGDLLYLSGHLPMKPDGSLVMGCCAPDHVIASQSEVKDEPLRLLTTQQGYEAAQHCALNLLSSLQSYLMEKVVRISATTRCVESADLSNVVKVVKLFGIVRSHPEFVEQHLVMNGASDTLSQILGHEVGGCHARSAIGTNALPLGICVEVEMIVKIGGVIDES